MAKPIRTLNLANFNARENLSQALFKAYFFFERRESGYCSIGWRQSSDTDGFKLSRGSASYNGGAGPSNCEDDAAIIMGQYKSLKMQNVIIKDVH